MNKNLPIGTVVLLKNATKKIMITGYAFVDLKKKSKVFDYCGCIYPEGVLTSNKNLMFDHENIDKIVFTGYQDNEQKVFFEKLNEVLEKEKNK